jgi:hypothetical protein
MIFQGQKWEDWDMEYSLGGRQGGAETPDLWRILLDSVMRRTLAKCHAESLGVCFEGSGIGSNGDNEPSDWLTFSAWADDIILYSKNLVEAKRMATILAEELGGWGLKLKPGSIEVLSTTMGAVQWVLAGVSMEVRMVKKMTVLGVALDAEGSSWTSIQHRISQA